MKSSEKLIEAIKGFEGLRVKAYKDAGYGILTIGYGHTGKDVTEGMVINERYALKLLREDLVKFENYVNGLGVARTQGEFDALVDFCFNLGNAALARSTLLKYIRTKKPVGMIQEQFRRWNKSNGKVLGGLVKRREWEAQRWMERR